MNQHTFLFAILLGQCCLWACDCCEDMGALQPAVQRYSVKDFDAIQVTDGVVVEVYAGDCFAVSARGDRRNVEDLKVMQEEGCLCLSYRQDGQRQYETYITVTMPALKDLKASDAARLYVKEFESQASVNIHLSDAASAQLAITSQFLNITAEGASQAMLEGTAEKMIASIHGASTLHADAYEIKEAILEVSSASHVRMWVTKQLRANVSGTSSIYYRGEPALVIRSSGASTVLQD